MKRRMPLARQIILRLCCTGFLLVGSSLSAATIPAFTGFSEMGLPCDLCDSYVNFSVYQSSDGNWTDDSIFSNFTATPLNDIAGQLGAVDTDAAYVYMYQVVNKDVVGQQGSATDNQLRDFSVTYRGTLPFTSGGYFPRAVFTDVNSTSVTGTNYSLDFPNPTLGNGPTDSPGDGAPSKANLAVANIGLATDASTTFPSSLNSTGNISNLTQFPGQFFDGVIFSWPDTGRIPLDGYSPVMFLTSDEAPFYLLGETESPGGSGSLGDVPSVPGTVRVRDAGVLDGNADG